MAGASWYEEGTENNVVNHESASDRTSRDRLLQAAIDVFARKGYSATTVREIVDTAGVTKPVLYYHFGSKEGIYLALMEGARTEFSTTLARAVAEGGPARQQVFRVLGGVLDLILANLGLVRIFHAMYYGPPQGAPFFDFELFHAQLVGTIRALVERGIAAREFRSGNVDDITMALFGAFDICQGMNLHHPELCIDRACLERVLDVIFSGVSIADNREHDL
jgi:TetR/AcrR family transcriptional regulator